MSNDPKYDFDPDNNILTLYCQYCNKAYKRKVRLEKDTFKVACDCRNDSPTLTGQRTLKGHQGID